MQKSVFASIGGLSLPLAFLLMTGCNLPRPTGPSPTPAPTLPPGPQPPPIITSVSPAEGLAGLSMLVDITGTGFQQGATVTLGDAVKSSSVSGSTLIRVLTPIRESGIVDVTVKNPDGQTTALTGGYAFRTVTLTASQSVVKPGDPVTVSWVAPGRSNPDVEGDWLGLFVPDAPDGRFLWAKYSTGATGELTLDAPTTPGTYEFRYLAGDGHPTPSVLMSRTPLIVSGS